MRCFRPRRPCAQGIGRTAGLSGGRIYCSSTCRIRSNRTSGRVCDRDGVRSERDALYSDLGESDKKCIDKSEPCIECKFRCEAEIAGLNDALSFLSGGESLIDQMSSKKCRQRHSVAYELGPPMLPNHHRIPALTDLRLHLR